MPTPYIGVTGFMTAAEVAAADEYFYSRSFRWHELMVGVLASGKTLAGRKNRWPNRYPDPGVIAELLPYPCRTVNLIHYATDDRDTLAAQFERLVSLGGESLDGFQLNIRWPDPAALVPLSCLRVVLQLGPGALKEEGSDPEAVAKRLDGYHDVITDVLVDASGGRGIPIDLDAAEAYVRAISARHPWLGIGVAGGLSAENVGGLKRLVDIFPDLSIDAEGRLRDADDRLDLNAVRDYLAAAVSLFA